VLLLLPPNTLTRLRATHFLITAYHRLVPDVVACMALDIRRDMQSFLVQSTD